VTVVGSNNGLFNYLKSRNLRASVVCCLSILLKIVREYKAAALA
jgi:hypothetical protein